MQITPNIKNLAFEALKLERPTAFPGKFRVPLGETEMFLALKDDAGILPIDTIEYEGVEYQIGVLKNEIPEVVE